MNFCPLDEKELDNGDLSKSSILLKARSLLVLSGTARQVKLGAVQQNLVYRVKSQTSIY